MNDLGIDASGKIPPKLVAEQGRALGRLTDIGWGATLRTLLSEQTPDAPVSDAVTDAIVKVLAAWGWQDRPTGIVTLPSRSRPALLGSLGQRIAAIGRLPYLGSLEYKSFPRTDSGFHNSAQRLAAVWDAFAVPDALRDSLSAQDGPVLVVDDRVDSGWTMTVAAKILREAGAPAVLPLVLAATTG
jgi:ATP-dependent DNA helicase RecQ